MMRAVAHSLLSGSEFTKYMSKSSSNWDAIAIGIVSIFLGLVAFAFTQSIFNLFFVPIIIAVLWSYTNKVNRLEAKLSQLQEFFNSEKQKAKEEDSGR